jgi:hypothetical protein
MSSYDMRGIDAPKLGVAEWQLRQFLARTASTSHGNPLVTTEVPVVVGMGVGPPSAPGIAAVPELHDAKAAMATAPVKTPTPTRTDKARMAGSMLQSGETANVCERPRRGEVVAFPTSPPND